jgi:glutathione S-transferase
MPPLLLKLVFDRIREAKMPFFARPIARGIAGKALADFVMPDIGRHLDFLEQELGGRAWFTGEGFTVADIQMSFPLEAARARAGLGESRPHLLQFLDRIHQRPAYARAIARGGEFSIAS